MANSSMAVCGRMRWLWPVLLIGLGLAGLMAALRPEGHSSGSGSEAVTPPPDRPLAG